MAWNVVIWLSLASVCWIVGKQTISEVIELFAEYAKGGVEVGKDRIAEPAHRAYQRRRAS